MPLPAQSLTPTSSDEEIQSAISESIRMCINEGNEPDQCKGMAYSMARTATGKKTTRLAMTEREE